MKTTIAAYPLPTLLAVLAVASAACSSSSSSSGADAGTDATSDASTDGSDDGDGASGDDSASESTTSADSALDTGSGADAPEAAAQEAGCMPTCTHRVCGQPDGCGGTCQATADAGAVGACLPYAQYNVNYGDPDFGGVCQTYADRNGTSCDSGAKRYCNAKGFATGFPTQTGTSEMTVLCVAQAYENGNVPVATLTGYIGTCPSNGYYSVDCEAASDDFCVAMGGYAGGLGPNEIGSGVVDVACLPTGVADAVNAPLANFTGANCVGPLYRSQGCDSDSDNYCKSHSDGTGTPYYGGFGPVQESDTNQQVTILCIKTQP